MATAKVAQPPVPSFQRIEAGSFNIPVHKFPSAGSSPSDPAGIANEVVKNINAALSSDDVIALANLFNDDCYWRDHLVLSWDLRTFKGKEKLTTWLKENGCSLKSIETDTSNAFTSPRIGNFDGVGDVKGVEFFFTFKSKLGTGRGTCRLSEDGSGTPKIFSFFTQLMELTGFEEPVGARRSRGVEHGGKPDRKNWLETRQAQTNYDEGREPTVVIVGQYPSLQLLSMIDNI
jgi:hypothetical protein